MGKDCPESSCPPESYILGHGEGVGQGGAARLQIFRGQPHVHGTIWQYGSYIIIIIIIIILSYFWDGPNNLGLYALDFSPFLLKGNPMIMHDGPMRPI